MSLYGWLQARGAIPPGATPADAVDKPTTARRPPVAYTPADVAALLETAALGLWAHGGKRDRHPHADMHVQIIALRAFAGIRLSELGRLTRAGVRLGQRRILIPDARAKAAGRSIPIRATAV